MPQFSLYEPVDSNANDIIPIYYSFSSILSSIRTQIEFKFDEIFLCFLIKGTILTEMITIYVNAILISEF